MTTRRRTRRIIPVFLLAFCCAAIVGCQTKNYADTDLQISYETFNAATNELHLTLHIGSSARWPLKLQTYTGIWLSSSGRVKPGGPLSIYPNGAKPAAVDIVHNAGADVRLSFPISYKTGKLATEWDVCIGNTNGQTNCAQAIPFPHVKQNLNEVLGNAFN